MQATLKQIDCFLKKVDLSFPVPLSHKQDLHEFSLKLYNNATMCYELNEGKIDAMVAGYTENLIDNIAYISIVATCKESQGKGLATKLVKKFINVCKNKGISAVHLYTDKSNSAAINMYKKIGFCDFVIQNEPRPNDIHLIYYI